MASNKVIELFDTQREAQMQASEKTPYVYRIDKYLKEEVYESIWFVSSIPNIQDDPQKLSPVAIASNWKIINESV